MLYAPEYLVHRLPENDDADLATTRMDNMHTVVDDTRRLLKKVNTNADNAKTKYMAAKAAKDLADAEADLVHKKMGQHLRTLECLAANESTANKKRDDAWKKIHEVVATDIAARKNIRDIEQKWKLSPIADRYNTAKAEMKKAKKNLREAKQTLCETKEIYDSTLMEIMKQKAMDDAIDQHTMYKNYLYGNPMPILLDDDEDDDLQSASVVKFNKWCDAEICMRDLVRAYITMEAIEATK